MAARKKIPSYIVPGLLILVDLDGDGDFEGAQEAVVIGIDRSDEDTPIAIGYLEDCGSDIEAEWVGPRQVKRRESSKDEEQPQASDDRTEEQAARDPRAGDRWEHGTLGTVTVARVVEGVVTAYAGGYVARGGSIGSQWTGLTIPACDWWAFVADCEYLDAVEAPR